MSGKTKSLVVVLSAFFLFSTGIAQNFSVPVNIAGGNSNYDLTVGFAPDATDGYDPDYDQYAPPAPPPPAFDAALGWGGDRYYTQIAEGDGDLSEHVWDVMLQFPEDNLITLTWDNTGWASFGSFVLQDAFGGLLGIDIDMTAESSLTLTNPAFNTLKLKVTPSDYTPPSGPTANFTYVTTDLEVTFTDASIPGDAAITEWSWDFGDGNSSTDQNPLHTYTSEGTYTVSLWVVDANGLDDTTQTDVTVTEPVGSEADFAVSMNAAGGNSNYDLTFGVSPDATDGYDPEFDQYAPPAPPPPAFDAALGWQGDRYYTQIVASTTEEIEYDIQLQFPEDNLIELTWDNTGWAVLGTFVLQDAFGGLLGIDIDMTIENSLTLTNPAFNTLKLFVTPSGAVQPTGPTAGFTYETNFLEVIFTDASVTGDEAITGWSWDFGDGNTSTVQNPIHTFTAEGTYAVTLVVTDANGLSDTAEENITVTAEPVEEPDFAVFLNVAGASSDYNLTFGVSPDATDGYDPDFDQYAPPPPPPPSFDAALGWQGDRYYTQIVASTFEERVFDILLQYADDNLIVITWNNNGWAPLGSFILQDAFGGAMINIDMVDLDPAVVSAAAGSLDMTDPSNPVLTLVNSAFNLLKVAMTASPPMQGPTAAFSGNPVSGYEPVTVAFTNSSTEGDGSIVSYSWDFGDGGTSADENPVYTYINAGTYTVSLTVTDENGYTDTETKEDYIEVLSTVELSADFSATPTYGVYPLSVEFTDLSVPSTGYSITSWNWDFGDGGTSIDQNPSYTYDSTGVYTVTLTVTDDTGSATEVKEDYITVTDVPLGDPEFAFSLTAHGPEFGYDMTFGFSPDATDGYDEDLDQYAPPAPPPPSFDAALGWQGDRYYVQILNGSSDDLVEHVYDILLQYADDNLITLTWDNTNWSALGTFFLTDAFDGALGINIDMTTETSLTLDNPAINILKLKIIPNGHSMPSADFIADITEGFPPLTVNFTDASEAGSSDIVGWNWDFGDGGSSNDQNPTYIYETEGTYTVSLTVTDQNGLSATETKEDFIIVNPFEGPTADFTADVTAGMPPLTVNFTDLSVTDVGYDIVEWSWDFGDSSTSVDQNPSHTFNEEGSFTVSLTVTDENGLTDTETKVGYITAAFEDLWPPMNLQAATDQHDQQVDVLLEWDAPQDPNAIFIHYDDGENFDGIGLTGGGTFSVAARWEPDQIIGYDGMFLTKVFFFPRGIADGYTIKIWTGTNAGTLVHQQNVMPVLEEWNEVTLDNAVQIDASQDLWIGYEVVNHPAGEYPAGVDAGPAVAGFGDMITLDGSAWESMSSSYGLNYNWNIQALLNQSARGVEVASDPILIEQNTIVNNEPTTKREIILQNGFLNKPDNSTMVDITRDFQYYKIYKDGEMIEVSYQTNYTDADVPDGVYEYYVTAQYDGGESEASNTVEVNVYFDPNIVDVDLYILLDDYPGETTWDLKDDGGNILYSGGPYNEQGGEVFETFNLSSGDYLFTIYDSYGDGICCGYGEGYYSLTMFGEIIVEGGEFTDEESTWFTVEPQIIGTIAGLVNDQDGNPLTDVLVEVDNTDKLDYTDDTGAYSIEIAPGVYSMTASKVGYADDTAEGVEVFEDDTTIVDLTLEALPTVLVFGHVTGFDAPDGLEGATIELTGYADFLAETDTVGSFTISGVYVNNVYNIKISKMGYQTYNNTVDVGTEDVDIGTVHLDEYTEPLWPIANLEYSVGWTPDEAMDVHLNWDPPMDPNAIELYYDDEIAENHWYVSDPVSGTNHLAVGFTYSEDCFVNTGKFEMSYDPGATSFDWNLLGGSASGPDATNILASGTTDLDGDPDGSWYFIDFGGVSISAGEWFYLDVQYRDGMIPGVDVYYAGGDASDIDPYSWYTVDGNDWNNLSTTTDIMFRAIISTEGARSITLAPTPSNSNQDAGIKELAKLPSVDEKHLAKITSVPYAKPQIKSELGRDLIGYNVYRDGDQLNTEIIMTTQYDDLGVPDGTYDYCVSAIYDGGESESVCVEIEVLWQDISLVIIDLDPTPTGESLKTALQNVYDGGIVVTGGIDEFSLTGMNAVFVLLGMYPNNARILPGEETALIDYIDSGGNLYMEGGDMWAYDPGVGAYDFGPHFGISGLSDGSGDLSTVTGYDFLQDMIWSYFGENSWVDQLAPVSNAVTVFRNDQIGYDCGVALDAGNYKTVGTSFEITGLGGTNSLDEALQGIIDFFGIGVPPGIVSGHVTLEGGDGNVEEVLITVGNKTTFPDVNGDYSIEIQPGTYDASAELFGYYPETVNNVVVVTEQTTTVDFTLGAIPTVSVFGQVVEFGTMNPLEGANIELSGYANYSGETNASGNFDIPGVYVDNTYSVQITYGILNPYSSSIDVGAEDYDLGVIVLSEVVYPPSNLEAEVVNYNDVYLTWNSPTGSGGQVGNILLVDDDNSINNGGPYDADVAGDMAAALTSSGFSFDEFVVLSAADGPDAQTMSDYDLVIWMTGYEWGFAPTLTSVDQTNLTSYTDNGGNLWLIGEDIPYDIGASNSFLSDVMGLASIIEETGNPNPYIGEDGTFMDGASYSQADIGFPDGPWGDDLIPGSGAFGIMNSEGSNFGAVANDAGNYRSVYWGMEFAFITDPADEADCVNRTLAWFTTGRNQELAGLGKIFAPSGNVEVNEEFPAYKAEALTLLSKDELQAKFVTVNHSVNTEPAMRELIGYNIYRNDDLIADNNPDTSFVDSNVPNGTYTYSVTAIYTSGESDPITVDVVIDAPLVADFSADATEGFSPLTVHFTDESLEFGTPIVAWYWEFGDGGTSNEQNPTHVYNDNGVYTVMLMVMDLSGTSAVEVKEDYISVLHAPGPGEFAVSMSATGNNISYDLNFGFASYASDGYDQDIDQYAPPPPPPPSFDAALGWLGDRYYTQILAVDIGVEKVFEVQLQYAEDNLIVLNWDNTGWADLGTFILTDAFDGMLGINIDMTVENSLTLTNPAFNLLKLKVTASGMVPGCDEEPVGFDFIATPYSGVFQGQATIDGIPADSCDWIAAFDEDGNCAGAQQLNTIFDGDNFINLPIYGDDPTTEYIDEGINDGEDFILVLWDASEDAYLSYEEALGGWFNNNGAPIPPYDDPYAIYDFLTVSYDNISLMTNWNLMSFDIEIENNAPVDVFAELIASGNLDYVTGFDASGALFFDPNGLPFLNTLTSVDPGFGYWVKVNEADDLVQQGMVIPVDYSIDLMTNWNLIAYWPQESITPLEAFAELIASGNLVYVTGFDESGALFFDPNGLPFLNTLTALENGFGYWVKVNEAVDGFQFPAPSGFVAKTAPYNINPDIVKTNEFMFVNGSVKFEHIDYVVGDKVSVLATSGLLVGEMEILNDGYLMTSAVYGNDKTTEVIDGAVAGEQLIFQYGEYQSEATNIRFNGNMELIKVDLMFRNIPEEYALAQNYPNPFNPVTTINYNLPDDSKVTLVIYDLMGRQIKTLVNEFQTAGFKSITWNATNEMNRPVSAGMYFYQLRAGNFVQIRKMVLLK